MNNQKLQMLKLESTKLQVLNLVMNVNMEVNLHISNIEESKHDNHNLGRNYLNLTHMAILSSLLVICNTWLTSLILLNTYNNVMEDLTSIIKHGLNLYGHPQSYKM